DFGTAIVYAGALGAALFIAGTRWWHLAALLGAAAFAGTFVLWLGPAMGVDILKPYQRARITGFANPSQASDAATYNLAQAKIAAGSIAFALLIQIFINVGMTVGMAPMTRIPLPFVSVGGSSMVANLLAIGLLQSICVRRR